MPTLRKMERSLAFILFPLKLLTSINDQVFVSIDNKLNKIKIPWGIFIPKSPEAFATDLAGGPEYSDERREKRVKRKHLDMRSWVTIKEQETARK